MTTNFWTASDKYVGSRVVYTNSTTKAGEYFEDKELAKEVEVADLKPLILTNTMFVEDLATESIAMVVGINANGLVVADVSAD